SAAIRAEDVTAAASVMSAVPEVRRALVREQRVIGLAGDCVVEGRDIGTVVFPDAALKFYIHADLEERTRRRAEELEARGEKVDVEGLRKQIEYRDETDKGRAVGPLVRAADAIDVDTTHLDEEATLERLLQEAKARGLC
ncbi:MAG: (d)CMP kinase, partial [Planctomycetota bacterium]|nr:(d)CMP kinase [Planctomycetota bacterium]